MKCISIMTPCYNEEENVREVVRRTREVMQSLPQYDYEHVFIDNASKDTTVDILREIAAEDPRVKVIVNARNFGHLRSPLYGLYQTSGDVVFMLFSDLQDPPELLIPMMAKWEAGYPVVLGIKTSSEESGVMYRIRTAYYRLIRRLTDIETFEHFTGFGLYDRVVIDTLKTRFRDPYPYFRGMIAETGFRHTSISYNQKRRERGVTKNNFYSLYDLAMLGITNLSKVPLRFATFVGFACAGVSVLLGLFYLIYKLLFWNNFSVGVAPIAIGVFFFVSIQLVCLGILGEYIGAIYTQVQNRPLVIERERINFGEAREPQPVTQIDHQLYGK
jgi:glycosyltransferase involved in cell wall biosynthesis